MPVGTERLSTCRRWGAEAPPETRELLTPPLPAASGAHITHSTDPTIRCHYTLLKAGTCAFLIQQTRSVLGRLLLAGELVCKLVQPSSVRMRAVC